MDISNDIGDRDKEKYFLPLSGSSMRNSKPGNISLSLTPMTIASSFTWASEKTSYCCPSSSPPEFLLGLQAGQEWELEAGEA